MFKSRIRDLIRRHWAPILLLLVLVSVNSAVFFGGRTLLPIAPSYGIVPGLPYGYKGPVADWTITLDPAASFTNYSYDAYAASTLKRGTFPFWNPYQGLGKPFLANYASAVLYPPNWLHLILPPGWWDLVYLLDWWLAAVFLFAFLRLWDLEPWVALLGAVAVLSSGAFQIYLPMREVAGVAAWWPLLLYGVERAIREPAWRARHLVLAMGVYCSVTGGQPEVTFLSLLTVLIYALVRLLSKPRRAWQGLIAIAPGSLAGLLLSAPLWVNFAQYAFAAYTTHSPELAPGAEPLGFNSLATYVFPYIYGRVHIHPFGPIPGWSWNLAPGWAPSVALFLGFVSMIAMVKKPRMGLGFLLGVAILVAAKIWGLPVINEIGRLPLLILVIFPRWASPLLALAVAGLSAFGANWLFKLDARKWLGLIAVWIILILALFAFGIQPIWPVIKRLGLIADSSVVLMLSGLAWALVAPLGLWWIKYRRPDDIITFFGLAVFGILLQGIAYSSNGYNEKTYIVLSFFCLTSYILIAGITGVARRIRPGLALAGSALIFVALVPLLTAFYAPSGLAARYNPLTPAPYIDFLRTVQANNLYRSYSFDCAPQPEFAAPFGFSSLDNIDPLLPAGSATFMRIFLDSRVDPLFFAGNLNIGEVGTRTAMQEYRKNKRYFDLVAVKYVVTRQDDPNAAFIVSEKSLRQDLVPLQLSRPVEKTLLCRTDELSSIEVLFSTYARKNPGLVTLSVLALDGTALAQSWVQGDDLVDNRLQPFEFRPITGLKGKQIRLRLDFTASQPDSMIVVWVPPDRNASDFAFRIPNQAAPDQEPMFSLIYSDREGDIRIWENNVAKPRVFLAPVASLATSYKDALSRLKDTPDLAHEVWLDRGPNIESAWPAGQPTSSIESFSLEPNDIWTKVQANTTGILTVTESYSDGWRAVLNGREVPVQCVNGAFLGVRVDEPGYCDLHFWYRPRYWNITLGMAGAGLLLILGGTFLSRRRS